MKVLTLAEGKLTLRDRFGDETVPSDLTPENLRRLLKQKKCLLLSAVLRSPEEYTDDPHLRDLCHVLTRDVQF
jgi:hypothetical protein